MGSEMKRSFPKFFRLEDHELPPPPSTTLHNGGTDPTHCPKFRQVKAKPKASGPPESQPTIRLGSTTAAHKIIPEKKEKKINRSYGVAVKYITSDTGPHLQKKAKKLRSNLLPPSFLLPFSQVGIPGLWVWVGMRSKASGRTGPYV
jgi:hypothetical protein